MGRKGIRYEGVDWFYLSQDRVLVMGCCGNGDGPSCSIKATFMLCECMNYCYTYYMTTVLKIPPLLKDHNFKAFL
jgi:hypothetical protein